VAKRNQSGLTLLPKVFNQQVPVPLYFEDQEQINAIHTHLTTIRGSTPTHTVTRSNSQSWISFFYI